ncbi:MAG: hypothetical protein KDB54_00860 [Solirubrobacterales bacterium]|nr:hypothetical protein [Solirubrobacterales bacterium]MCB0859186.1 hypothetical protein [Solirubrobacterales bacterium]HRV58994.1 SGNH hydrolase domain-containing protein [Solirubrobacterales bacterium]
MFRSPKGRLAAALTGTVVAAFLLGSCEAGTRPATIADLIPAPGAAKEDKGPAILDGCRSGTTHTEAWSCVYGDPGSEQTVVLWGDSHAMQYLPPFVRLAQQRGWRLVTMFRGNCLTADTPYKPNCDAWRANAFERIEEEQPDLVVTSTDTGNGYALWQDGERLTRDASEPLLRAAYARTLERLEGMTGDRPGGVMVIRDLPRASFRPPDCLLENPDDLAACDFRGFRKNAPGFDLAAARQVGGVRLVDLSDIVCPGGICSSAHNDMVVYRDMTHLSATYAATLTDWFGEQVGSLP